MNCFKASFANENFAEQFVQKLIKTSNRKVKPQRAYLCEKCFNWHLTSKPLVISDDELTKQEYKIKKLNNKIQYLENYIKGLLKRANENGTGI
jgi:catalase (peroxidase I)